jgi:hypothetical protein
VIVEKFLAQSALPELIRGFPALRRHGSFPYSAKDSSPAFRQLAAELEGPELRDVIQEKFAIDLAGRPTMITLRGHSDDRDGHIHTDSETKLITLLLYMNPEWEGEAGRLRLLRSADDLEDFVAEVPPLAGMMVAFRRSAHSFHGHHPHIGERRSIQLNWLCNTRTARRELSRHRWSARLKALNPFS